MMSLRLSSKTFRPIGWFARIWQTPLGKHHGDVAQRYLTYVLSPILIGVLTYITMHYLGISRFPGYYKSNILYHHHYALETALNFGFWLYLVEEWGCRMLGSWTAQHRRTVGVTAILWTCGFVLALVLQITFIFERIEFYAPRIMHFYDLYPLSRPSLSLRLVIFLIIWIISLNSRLVLGMLLQRSAQQHQQVAGSVPGAALEEGETIRGSSSATETVPGAPAKIKPLSISDGKAVSVIEPDHLILITSEGHYCRFMLRAEDKTNEIFTRIALRDVIAELPSEDFIQIHRSHVINRHYIEGLKKSGRSYALHIDGSETLLPISRYRWPAIRKRLNLSKSTEQCMDW